VTRETVGARAWPNPYPPRISGRSGYTLHTILSKNRVYARFAAFVERHPWLYRRFTAAERLTKEATFGCRMCGQCALPATGYACPMTCPKQLRNGPCGGVSPTGACEVHPELRCVWVIAYERADRAGHAGDLDQLQRPIDQREWGRSSWLNYWQGRDDDLAASPTPQEPRPLLRRELGLVSR